MRIRNILQKSLPWTASLSILIAPKMVAQRSFPTVTINDLVKRTLIEKASVSPDGRFVAFLTAKGMPTLNSYEIETRIISLTPHRRSTLLSRSWVRPEEVFDATSGALLPSAGSFAWSPNGRRLLFTDRTRNRSEVLSLDINTGQRRRLFHSRGWIEIEHKGSEVRLINHHIVTVKKASGLVPHDVSVRVGEGAGFVKPFEYPSYFSRAQTDEWTLSTTDTIARTVNEPESKGDLAQERGLSKEATVPAANEAIHVAESITSPSKDQTAVLEWLDRNLQSPAESYRTSRIVLEPDHRVLAPETKPACFYSLIGWGIEDHNFFYIRKDRHGSSIVKVNASHTRVIFTDQASLDLVARSLGGPHGDDFGIFVRSTNIMPDELVMIDLRSGKMRLLYAPNAYFQRRLLPSVQLISIPGSPIYGRLYLPPRGSPIHRLPLVFTGYMSGPGFEASVGDELPVLVLASRGIAVFAMNAYGVNVVPASGNFDFELSRLARPLEAMEFLRSDLASDGTIDPDRCGIAGVSYSAEIAMYAYWKSRMFKAVSVATASWGPMDALLVGTAYGDFLRQRGFPSIVHPEDERWKAVSAAPNARADLPPLLLQSSSEEEYFGNVEIWMQLHRVHAPVTWYSYPHEGHVKRSPANKWWVYQRNLDWFCRWLLPKDPSLHRAKSGTEASTHNMEH